MPKLLIKRLTPTAIIPAYKTDGAAGMDLHADIEETVVLKPGERRLIPCGIAIQLPLGYEAQIRPRSGLALKNGITVVNSPGTIDCDYRGPIGVILLNTSGSEGFIIGSGDRIAQMVIAPAVRVDVFEATDLDLTDRGEGGFGSTGVR